MEHTSAIFAQWLIGLLASLDVTWRHVHMIREYKGLVLLVLEYGSLLLNPQSKLFQDEHEKMQKRAARFVTGS